MKNLFKKSNDILIDIDVNQPTFGGSRCEYIAITANGFRIHGKYNGGKIFIRVKKNKEFLENVTLEADIYPESNELKIHGIDNRNQQTENKKTGLATNMLVLLLTILEDLNESSDSSKKIQKITGSVVPLNQSNLKKLKKYYRKRSGLTDFYERISINIDRDELKQSNLLYYVQPKEKKER